MKVTLIFLLLPALLPAQVVIQIKADQVTARVSPRLYGLMTEEINYSYEGGLYGELIRNRSFAEDAKEPVHWSLVQEQGGVGSMKLDADRTLTLTVAQAGKSRRAGIANDGYWGIPVRPNTPYQAAFYAKAETGSPGSITAAIVSSDGTQTYATGQVARIGSEWRRYEVTLRTGKVRPGVDARFELLAGGAGTYLFNFVSLFPPTYKNRANGNRPDIMQLLADMNPKFLRFPGGNYLEGNTIATRFDWKKTLGPVAVRPGHMNDGWKYWSSDGMGLLEFLNWCEDLHMEPVLAVYAGYSMHQERIAAGAALDPYVKDALDEIEYVSGDASTTWGSKRARDGHEAPFRLEYVEVGNEDNFDRQEGSYEARFQQFFKAIKAKYPQLQVIATAKTAFAPDVIDEHYYRRSEDEMSSHAHDYDDRPRTGPKVFVGEWATRVGEPTPNMSAALGDAAWMTGMERNSDLVIMSCYAPLFVNVNKGAMQWKTDLIGYDGLTSYGSPAYYAQQIFSRNHGDTVLASSAQGIPTHEWQPLPSRANPTVKLPLQQVPMLFYDVTRDSATGAIYLKVVNRAGAPQPVKVEITGAAAVDAKGQTITLSAASPDDTNSITEPKKLVPVTADVAGLGKTFTRTVPAYSITVLKVKSR